MRISSLFSFSVCVAVALAAVAPACGGVKQATVDNTGDGGGGGGGGSDGSSASATDSGLAGFPDAGSFCSGDAPRMIINGAEVTLLQTRGKAVVLNCCDSAELELATGSFQSLFYLLWRARAGQSPGLVDLGNPPASFSVELDLGCDPATSPCNTGSAEEHYSTGFQGQISYGNGATASTTSYCLSVAEQKNSPHSVVHSLSIYAPNIPSMQ